MTSTISAPSLDALTTTSAICTHLSSHPKFEATLEDLYQQELTNTEVLHDDNPNLAQIMNSIMTDCQAGGAMTKCAFIAGSMVTIAEFKDSFALGLELNQVSPTPSKSISI